MLTARGAPATIASETIETLPTFTVVDSKLLPPPEKWRYAQIPGFEILADTSDRTTKRFVGDFLLLQEVVQAIMPGLVDGKGGVPTTMIICGRSRSFETFLRHDQTVEARRLNSLFLENPEHAAIVVDFALDEIELDGMTREESDPYRAFYLEYFRFLVRRSIGSTNLPWFEEGMVQLMASMDFNPKRITFGEIVSESSGAFNRRLAQHALLPMGQLLTAEKPVDETAYWSAQAYAFVHFCLYGEHRRYQRAFIEFVMRASREPVTEELFKTCFKMSYRDMGIALRGYTTFASHQYVEFTAKKGTRLPEPPPVALRAATDAEVGRLKGEALRLGSQPDPAHLALVAPFIRGERDPQLLAALGLDEIESGHDDRARKFLEAAVAGNVIRPRAYLALARFRYDDARAKPAAPGDKFSPAQTASILGPLAIASGQPPPLPAVYSMLADVLLRSSEPPRKGDLEILYTGINHFPRQSELVYLTALLSVENGYPAGAEALIERGLKTTDEKLARVSLN